jgi:hypothetical protein
MDVLDKHQLLIATVARVDLSVPLRLDLATAAHDAEMRGDGTEVNVDAQKAVDIVFPEFGVRKNQPVIPCLFQLANFVELEVVRKLLLFVK